MVTLTVVSPITQEGHEMTCIGHQMVTCNGGTGAVVYLY
jgi:hypothetical protein